MIDNKDNVNLPTWYKKYGTALNETIAGGFSEEPKERLRQYLEENPGLINVIGDKLSKAKQKDLVKITLDHTKYKIVKGDRLMMRVDKTHSGGPDAERVYISVENFEMMKGNIHFKKAAQWFNKSMAGPGTYEEMFAATASAMHMDLAQRGVSSAGVQEVFDAFSEEWYKTKYSESWGKRYTFKDWIEGDFSGRTEVCAMVLTRQPIPEDFTMGINWGSIAVDVGLLLLTLPVGGAGYWLKASLQAGKGATKATKALQNMRRAKKAKDAMKRVKNIKKIRAAKGATDAVTGVKIIRYADALKGAGKTGQILKAGDQLVEVTPAMAKALKAWKGLKPDQMQKAISQTFKNGDKFQYFTRGGKLQNVQFAGFSPPTKAGNILVVMREVDKTGNLGGTIRTGMKNFVNFGDDAAALGTRGAAGAGESIKMLDNAGVATAKFFDAPWNRGFKDWLTAAGLIGAHHLNPEWMGDSEDSTTNMETDLEYTTDVDAPEVTGLQTAGEVSGWYNAMMDDSQEYVDYYKSQGALELVEQLHDAMDGWTDDTDELAIAFMILAMDKTTALNVKQAWDDLYADEGGFYENIISGELEAGGWGFGANMRSMVGSYWYALTQDGDNPYKGEVDKIFASITKKSGY